MSMSTALRTFLEDSGQPYEVVRHERAFTSQRTAQTAHVPGDRLAKTVLLADDDGYLLAVVPATHQLLLGALHERLGQRVDLGTEQDMAALFKGCETGAIPPFGEIYGLRTLVDEALLDSDEVYCESGDHTELVHLSGTSFRALLRRADHGRFSRHV